MPLLLTAMVFFCKVTAAYAAPGNTALKIYEVAGAGGLSGATYRQDTIVLFNPTQSTVNCSTCTIQIHSGTSNTAAWTVYQLPTLTIPAGGFYMISASSPTLSTSGSTSPIPYDYRLKTIEGTVKDGTSGDNILSSTVGVVALTSTQTALTASANTLCGTGTQLLDFIGYGSNVATNSSTTPTPASCYAGSGEAPYDGSTAFGRQLGATRKNKCIDTFDNANDFINAPLTYFNSASPATPCPSGTQLSAAVYAAPSNPSVGGTVTIKAVVTNASQPASNGITAFLDFNTAYFGGSALQMYDDGTHGDAVAGDGTYTLTATIPASVTTGFVYPANVTVNDSLGNSYTGTTSLSVGLTSVSQSSGNSSIRIVAWYGAGNLSKSEYARDTIILFNASQGPITMNNWSLQSGGASGSFSAVSYLLPVVTLPAGGYYAITGSGPSYISSSGCVTSHCNLNYAYDYQLKTLEGTATSTDNDLSSTAATIALVDNQVALGTGCPTGSPHLVDLVGIGASDGSSPVTCYAGTGYAPYTPSTLNGATTNINGVVYAYATVRRNKCGNTFDNANDFMLGFIDFANANTPATPCPTGTQMAVTGPGATPTNPGVLDPVTFFATVTPATSPGSTSLRVTADLSNLGLSASAPMYDDGTHGDAKAGDQIYTLATSATSGTPGAVPGLIVTAADAQGNVARNLLPLTLAAGNIVLTSPKTTATVKGGDVLTLPITITGQHGYGGVLNLTCTGTPNANSLGLPISTQCVSTPPEVTIATDGTATVSLAIATGTTFSAGMGSRSVPWALAALAALGGVSVGFLKRRRLISALTVGLLATVVFGASGCGTNAGLGNTAAAPGTYTYTLTATDATISSVSSSMTFTVTVQ